MGGYGIRVNVLINFFIMVIKKKFNNFDELFIVLDLFVLVDFYVIWCGFCKMMVFILE